MQQVPTKYKDALAREFVVDITVATLKRLRQHLAFNLDDLAPMVVDPRKPRSKAEREAEAEAAMKPLQALLDDDAQFSEVLYLCVKPSAVEQEIDHAGFDDGYSDQSIYDAKEAFVQSLHDFFPQAPRKLIVRGILEQMKAMRQMETQAMKRVEKAIGREKATLSKEVESRLNLLDEQLSSFASSSPAMSAASQIAVLSESSPG